MELRKKSDCAAPITKSRLERDFNSYLVTPDSNQVLKIVEDHNLKSLFEVAHSVVGLSSQGMLEAAFSGIRPTQFGDAFFGRKGFTNDYALDAVATFVSDLLTNKIENRLGLAEYQSFEIFSPKHRGRARFGVPLRAAKAEGTFRKKGADQADAERPGGASSPGGYDGTRRFPFRRRLHRRIN